MPASLVNGEPDELIPVSDRGFQYGDGVFETVRIANRQPTLWQLHMQRLRAGCKFLKIPFQNEPLEQDLDCLLKANASEGVIKIIYTRGSGGRGYQPPEAGAPLRVVQFFPLPQGIDDPKSQGARVKICTHPLSSNPRLVRYKHLCRIDQVIASTELSGTFAEGIMLTETGQIIEGTRSNLFMAQGGRLVTPVLATAGIQGVMRQYLLARFAAEGLTVQEQVFGLGELFDADEVFLCNSVFGVWPITELVHGEIVKQLQIGRYSETAVRIADEVFVNQD